jgi:hypothetical protein
MARWTASFCSGDGRQAGLLYLAAGYRDTTGIFDDMAIHESVLRNYRFLFCFCTPFCLACRCQEGVSGLLPMPIDKAKAMPEWM